MTTHNGFTPGGTVTVAATTTSATTRVALAKSVTDQTLWVQNVAGGAVAFVNFGDSSVSAAAATSTPILPGSGQLITVGPDATHVAGVTGATSATVYVTSGRIN